MPKQLLHKLLFVTVATWVLYGLQVVDAHLERAPAASPALGIALPR